MQVLIIIIVLIVILGLAFAWYWYTNTKAAYFKTTVSESINSKVVLNIAVPRNNDKSPMAAEQLFAALHGTNLGKAKAKEHFSFEIVAGNYGVFFLCVVSTNFKTFFENQIYSQFPEAQITVIEDYAEKLLNTPGQIQITELGLITDSSLPIKTFLNFDVDPLAGITGAMSNLPAGQEVFVQYATRPVDNSWHKLGNTKIKELKEKLAGGELEPSQKDQVSAIEKKQTKFGFQMIIRVLVKAPDEPTTNRLSQEVIAAFSQYRTSLFNGIGPIAASEPTGDEKLKIRLFGEKPYFKTGILNRFINRMLPEDSPFIINTEELASIYHLPNRSVETPNIAWARYKQLEYPLNLPSGSDSRIIGATDYRGQHNKFGILNNDRLRHMYVIGKTGTGKSTFMEGQILADIYEGKGVGVIDPHGELIDNLLNHIPEHRIKDVMLFDPGDTNNPIAFNLLETAGGEDKSLVADGIVTVFRRQFGTSWGPRLEYILTNALITLLNCQNVSLMVLPRLLMDDNYRKFLLKQLKDPLMLKFWEQEYEPLARDPKRRDAEIASILNKIGRFTTNPMIRNIIGQVKSSFNIRQAMDEGKILLINLAQGRVGEENMALLGGMLISRFYTSAVMRQDTKERRPFYLFVDEFQNFATPTFEKILSEARKYGLGLTIAHQFIDQIEPSISNAIFGNVGSIINFAVGPKDAEVLVRQYAPYLSSEDLVNLGKGKIVTKISIDSSQSKPFTAKTFVSNFPVTGTRELVINNSRLNYGSTKQDIETKLFKWAAQQYTKTGLLFTEEMQKLEDDAKAAKQLQKDTNPQAYTNSPKPQGQYNNQQQNTGGYLDRKNQNNSGFIPARPSSNQPGTSPRQTPYTNSGQGSRPPYNNRPKPAYNNSPRPIAPKPPDTVPGPTST